jgi:hypothetical protein
MMHSLHSGATARRFARPTTTLACSQPLPCSSSRRILKSGLCRCGGSRKSEPTLFLHIWSEAKKLLLSLPCVASPMVSRAAGRAALALCSAVRRKNSRTEDLNALICPKTGSEGVAKVACSGARMNRVGTCLPRCMHLLTLVKYHSCDGAASEQGYGGGRAARGRVRRGGEQE